MGKLKVGNTQIIDGALELPIGGATGQLLKKASTEDRDVAWGDQPVPIGGTTGQILAKINGTDFNLEWVNPVVGGIPNDGWTNAAETWTYASASTVTVATGAASRYQKDDKIKWTQTTVKYGVIIAVADTLLTIAVNDDHVFANAAISANYISKVEAPFGFPLYFNFTPTVTSGGGTPTTVTKSVKYQINAGKVFIAGSLLVVDKGTATGSMKFSLPAVVVGVLCGSSMDVGVSGILGTCFLSSDLAVLQKYDASTYWLDNYNVWFSVTYFF